MCNLYSMTATVDELRRLFGPFDGDTANLPRLDEIYPGHAAPVLRRVGDGGLKLERMTWGFPGPAAAGGRPVTKRKAKVWFGLHQDAHPLFAFAGIWRPGSKDGEGPFMAFLTCAANEIVGAVHPKAMPVMLRPGADVDRWLSAERPDACALAVPFADADMRRMD